MRSEAVSGWPKMFTEGFNDSDEEIELLHRRKLSENVMFCLFSGDLKELKLHLKPEVLHFGVHRTEGGDVKETYTKKLRNDDGEEKYNIYIPFKSEGVLDIKKLMADIDDHENVSDLKWKAVGENTSADLAIQLIEGVESVHFLREPENN